MLSRDKPSIEPTAVQRRRRASTSVLVGGLGAKVISRGELDLPVHLKSVKKKNFSYSYLKELKAFAPRIFVERMLGEVIQKYVTTLLDTLLFTHLVTIPLFLCVIYSKDYNLASFSHPVYAAVVIADIAGFTRLTAALEVEKFKTCIKYVVLYVYIYRYMFLLNNILFFELF